ncbi:MAG: radical SAM protein [Oligoflexia bacterium]|nr:radical SAM protein [Oligoflexia bacterium]MBF0365223.1 radical SAM protein [Oligoflexia bacterium]
MSSVISKFYLTTDRELSKEERMMTQKLKPHTVILEITSQCNMQCAHCRAVCKNKQGEELSLREHITLADELVKLGPKHLFLSGGEALLSPHWKTLAHYYHHRGVRIILLSNGLLIPKCIDDIVKSPISQIAISIDGLKKTHEMIRGVRESFEIALSSLDLIKQKGQGRIITSVITTVSKWNIDELEDLYQVLSSRGIILWQIQRPSPHGQIDRNFMLDSTDISRLYQFIHAKRELRKNNPSINVMGVTAACNVTPFYKENTRSIGNDYTGCPAGLFCLGIEANGNVKGCLTQSSEFIEGNIRERPLSTIWNDPHNFAYNRFFYEDKIKGSCQSCNFVESDDHYNQSYCLHLCPLDWHSMKVATNLARPNASA